MPGVYRLYIDESGDHNYSDSDEIKAQFLALAGVIIERTHNAEYVVPGWDALRSIFSIDHDFPTTFHYVDVVNKKREFGKLKDVALKELYNDQYLAFLREGSYMLFTVVIDKKSHKERYGEAAMHPYHYCLNVVVERFVNFLIENDATGDVMVESRGKRENKLLCAAFRNFYDSGTDYLPGETIQRRLTSRELKLETKEARIAGLEMADMLATPLKFLTLRKYGIVPSLSDNFTKTVLEAVIPKIRKNPRVNNHNAMRGYGLKLLK